MNTLCTGSKMIPDTVIVHNHCLDGLGAAYICRQKYPAARIGEMPAGAVIDIGRMISDGLIPIGPVPVNVMFVDFFPELESVCHLANTIPQGSRIVILDHHLNDTEIESMRQKMNLHQQNAQNGVKLEILIDCSRSGCELMWDYIHNTHDMMPQTADSIETGRGSEVVPYPEIMQYISDHDLGKYNLPNSDLVSLYMRISIMGIRLLRERMTVFESLAQTPIATLAERGVNAKPVVDALVQERILFAREMGFVTPTGTVFRVWAVSGCQPLIMSSVGQKLLHTPLGSNGFLPHFVVIVNSNITAFGRHSFSISLRSRPDFDVFKIAAMFRDGSAPRGGGHRPASTFKWFGPLDQILVSHRYSV